MPVMGGEVRFAEDSPHGGLVPATPDGLELIARQSKLGVELELSELRVFGKSVDSHHLAGSDARSDGRGELVDPLNGRHMDVAISSAAAGDLTQITRKPCSRRSFDSGAAPGS